MPGVEQTSQLHLASIWAPARSNFGKLYFAGHNLGELSSYNSVPKFSDEGQNWIRERTGVDARFEQISDFSPPQQMRDFEYAEKPHDARTSLDATSLPEKSVVEHCISVYNSSILRLIFPIIDVFLFSETLNRAYGSVYQDSYGAVACIWAFLSVVPIFAFNDLGSPLIDNEVSALKARIFMSRIMDDNTIDGLQAVGMLVGCYRIRH
jgi:hypothetical protein